MIEAGKLINLQSLMDYEASPKKMEVFPWSDESYDLEKYTPWN